MTLSQELILFQPNFVKLRSVKREPASSNWLFFVVLRPGLEPGADRRHNPGTKPVAMCVTQCPDRIMRAQHSRWKHVIFPMHSVWKSSAIT
jgi:hypothetical protein